MTTPAVVWPSPQLMLALNWPARALGLLSVKLATAPLIAVPAIVLRLVPLALIESVKFYEVQKYCSLTNHAWEGFWLLSSARIWKTIPQDAQQVMQKYFNAAAKKQRDDIVQADAEYRKILESKGLTFNSTQAEIFQTALAKTSFYKDAKAKFGDEAWTLLQKYAGSIG